MHPQQQSLRRDVVETSVTTAAELEQSQAKNGAHLFLLIDTSLSMRGEPLAAVQREIKAIVDTLRPEDAVTVWTFNGHPARCLTHCKVHQLKKAWNKLRADLDRAVQDSIGTNVYDAVADAMADCSRHARGRRIARFFVVLSDGEDNRSRLAPAAARSNLQASRRNICNLHMVFVAAGAPGVYADLAPRDARVISVGSNGSADISRAFLDVTKCIKCTLRVTSTDPATGEKRVVAAGLVRGRDEEQALQRLERSAAQQPTPPPLPPPRAQRALPPAARAPCQATAPDDVVCLAFIANPPVKPEFRGRPAPLQPHMLEHTAYLRGPELLALVARETGVPACHMQTHTVAEGPNAERCRLYCRGRERAAELIRRHHKQRVEHAGRPYKLWINAPRDLVPAKAA